VKTIKIDNLIVGAGVSGLSAGFFLNKKTDNFLILEKNKTGGLIQTIFKNDLILETGATVLVFRQELEALCKELSLKIKDPKIKKFKQLLLINEKIYVVPKSLLSFLKFSLVSFQNKISFLYNIFFKQINNFSKDISVSEFLAPFFGKVFVDKIISTALMGIYGSTADKLSSSIVLRRIITSKELTFFKYFKSSKKPKSVMIEGGNSQLTDSLEARLKNKINIEEVLSVEDLNSKLKVVTNKNIYITKNLFLGVSSDIVSNLIINFDKELSKVLEKNLFCSLNVVHLIVDKLDKQFENSFGLLTKENTDNIVGVMHNTEIFPQNNFSKQLLTISIKDTQLSKSDIKTRVSSFLKKYYNISEFEIINVRFWNKAIPSFNVGYDNILLKIEKFHKKNKNIFLFGSLIGGIGVSDRIKEAKNIIKDCYE